MTNTLQQNLEAANLKDSKTELFSEDDLKEFNALIKDKESFDELVKGFEDEATIKEIQSVKGLEESLEISIGTKKNLAGIFDKSYEETIETDKDLYEMCVLGAILTKGKTTGTDYKVLAKEYYESINPTIIESSEEKKSDIEGTYATASSEMKTETITQINTELNIENGKNITEASITVSAGADKRKMNEAKAKSIYDKKIETLKKQANKFTQPDNKQQITTIVTELENIENLQKISKDEIDQNGNRYLIAARMTEGFIEALNKLTLKPEPKLTLKINREACAIGNIDSDIEKDRFVKLNITITTEESDVQQINTNKQQQIGSNNKETQDLINNNKQQQIGSNNKETQDLINNNKQETIDNKKTENTNEDQTNKTKTENKTNNETETARKKPEKTIETTSGGTAHGPNANTPKIEMQESPETLQLKQDIANHFTFEGNDINAQDVSDILENTANKNQYQVSIKGYSDFVVSYVGDTIEISQGTVKKGLLKFDNKNKQTTKVDRVNKDRTPIKKNIELTFNTTKSKEYINEKLKNTTTGDQGKYEVKNDADVTESTIKVQYTNTNILKPGQDGKSIIDPMVFSLDSEYMISKGKDKSIPLERQKAKGETEKINCIKPYKIDDETTKISYYVKTSGGIDDPSIKIVNNIVKTQEDTNGNVKKTPVFSEYTNLTKQDKTLEEYTEKVMLGYDTPKTTSIEKKFEETATVEYNENKYSIKATFDTAKGPLILTLPINYVEGSAANQNTSSVKYGNKPLLSRTDNYNKIDKGMVIIDGIVYDIGVADQKQKNMPTIYFRHIENKTLDKVKEWTKPYKIESNIFGIKTMNDGVQGYTGVNAGFGNSEFGPLTVKDGNRSDPVTYYKEVFVGQVRDGNQILLQGTKIGTMYFDQQGGFLSYNTNEQQMTFDKQTNEVDLTDNTPIGMKNPLGKAGKNILITQDLIGTVLKVNIMNADDIYTGKKTGTDFVKTQDADKAKDMDENFYTSAETKLMIAESRILIYEGLKKLSSDDVNEKNKDLFNRVTEKDKKPNTVLGPDWKGVYAYKLIKANGEYPAQYIYCKVSNKKISLCNSDGDVLDQQKIFLEANNDYYNIKLNDDETQFAITGKEEEEQYKIPKIEINTNKDNKPYIGDLTNERYCGYRSSKENEDSYQFMSGKYKSFEIDMKGDTIEGVDKITDINSFSLVDENEEGFGSYKDFFVTEYQKNLGIDESTYKEVFTKVMQEKEKNTDNLVRVKYKKGKKFYYMPMNVEVNKKKGKTTFEMEPSTGWEETIKETEKRLANLVKAYSIFLEQDVSADKAKGDLIQGWYLVKPTIEATSKYFKDPSAGGIEMTLQTNNKISGEYQKETIIFDPTTNTIDKKSITVNGIEYGLSIKSDNKVGYKIIVKKGDVRSAE